MHGLMTGWVFRRQRSNSTAVVMRALAMHAVRLQSTTYGHGGRAPRRQTRNGV